VKKMLKGVMSMKGWGRATLLMALVGLTACTTTETYQIPVSQSANLQNWSMPPANAMRAMPNARSQSAMSQDFPLTQETHQWTLSASNKVVIETNEDLLVVPSSTNQTLLMTNAPATLKLMENNGQLTLHPSFNGATSAQSRAKILLMIPSRVQNLTITGAGRVQALDFPPYLRELALKDVESVDLHGQQLELRQLFIDGVKQARIEGARIPYLLMHVNKSGPVELRGNIGLRELVLEDTAPVNVYWVNSRQLLMNVDGHEKVFLAGVADLLIANVHHKAKLNAKYLRTQKAFVNTQQTAIAEVSVLDSLNAYAQGQSNIYYYHQPKLLGRYYQDHGSVIYMGKEAPPCLGPECPHMPNPLPG
jgi:hypothetical protein